MRGFGFAVVVKLGWVGVACIKFITLREEVIDMEIISRGKRIDPSTTYIYA